MMAYSPKILKAYTKWINAIDGEPSEPYDPKYKSWKAKEKRCAKNFEAACREENYNYCDVYRELLGKITIKK